MAPSFHFEHASLEEALEAKAQHGESRRPVLLLVDDEELIVHTLSTILTRSGFTVLTACDGYSALDLARMIPPDLLITDVAMPGMDGIELAMSVVCEAPDCRVLLFSGHAQPHDLEAARSAGFDFPLLTKPVHPRTMLANVNLCLEAAQLSGPRSVSPDHFPIQLAS